MTLFLFPFTLVYLLAMELNNKGGEIKSVHVGENVTQQEN